MIKINKKSLFTLYEVIVNRWRKNITKKVTQNRGKQDFFIIYKEEERKSECCCCLLLFIFALSFEFI